MQCINLDSEYLQGTQVQVQIEELSQHTQDCRLGSLYYNDYLFTISITKVQLICSSMCLIMTSSDLLNLLIVKIHLIEYKPISVQQGSSGKLGETAVPASLLHSFFLLLQVKHRPVTKTYPVDCVLLVTTLRLAALRMSLSSVATIWVNLGRRFLSFTQQSSMSWCRAVGQSMGGGSR